MVHLFVCLCVAFIIILQAVSGVFALLSHFAFEIGRSLSTVLSVYVIASLIASSVLLFQGRLGFALAIASVSLVLNVFIASRCR